MILKSITPVNLTLGRRGYEKWMDCRKKYQLWQERYLISIVTIWTWVNLTLTRAPETHALHFVSHAIAQAEKKRIRSQRSQTKAGAD